MSAAICFCGCRHVLTCTTQYETGTKLWCSGALHTLAVRLLLSEIYSILHICRTLVQQGGQGRRNGKRKRDRFSGENNHGNNVREYVRGCIEKGGVATLAPLPSVGGENVPTATLPDQTEQGSKCYCYVGTGQTLAVSTTIEYVPVALR